MMSVLVLMSEFGGACVSLVDCGLVKDVVVVLEV